MDLHPQFFLKNKGFSVKQITENPLLFRTIFKASRRTCQWDTPLILCKKPLPKFLWAAAQIELLMQPRDDVLNICKAFFPPTDRKSLCAYAAWEVLDFGSVPKSPQYGWRHMLLLKSFPYSSLFLPCFSDTTQYLSSHILLSCQIGFRIRFVFSSDPFSFSLLFYCTKGPVAWV